MKIAYSEALTVDGWHLYRCGACHGLVVGEDQEAHTAWHEQFSDWDTTP